jgi:superfamily II DNA or RNA helicase
MSRAVPKIPGMGDFDTLYASLSENSQLRGRQFERIVKWFLENDPVYRHELKNVWLWDEWPDRWGGDAGIDLVAEDRNGDRWAIQAKAYDPKYRVSKKDVDKFLAESGRKVFTYRMLIATTDLIDRTGERTLQQQEKHSSFFRLNDLRAAVVDWPTSPAALRPARPRKPAKPRPHQKDAIRDVVKGFTAADRGQLVMACGTGKTLTALFITEKLASKRTLVLLPSLSLLKQTLNEWRANATTEFASLPVCSDESVSQAEDTAVAHTSDLHVPVTTSPDDIAAFLRRKSGPLVVFSTYQSSPQIEKAFALGRVPGFDLIIADEAHRVAGKVSRDFGTVLDPKAIRGERRLFMTATPRVYAAAAKKAAAEEHFSLASMDDHTKFGEEFHRLSFGEAIRRELLTDYQVVVVGIDDATYGDWAQRGVFVSTDGQEVVSAAALAGQIGLAKAMRKYDLRRVISFHRTVSRSREFAADLEDVINWMPPRQRPKGTLWARHASGTMPAGDRYVLLQRLGRLGDGERGLLANARCLSEGVDVPTLDAVAFIDPRSSEVDIIQAVGRAIRKSETKTVGTIVIPVFVSSDEDPQTVLNDSVFKPVWAIIRALRSHDEELGAQLDQVRREMGRTGAKPRLPPKIHLDIPSAVGTDFADAFDAMLVRETTFTWPFWYGVLEKFVSQHGHTRIPALELYDGLRLGQWVSQQRYLRNKGLLEDDRALSLEQFLDWTWDAVTDQWEEGFRQLVTYCDQHGDCLVSQKFRTESGHKLGSWVTMQRADYRSGELTEERRKRLEELPGWAWAPRDSRWEKSFQRLVEYAAEHGHTRVVRGVITADGADLGSWVQTQRGRHSRGVLAQQYVARLEALPGWVWDVNEALWERGFELLAAYAAAHGGCDVPQSYKPDGHNLGVWVALQRANGNSGKLREDYRARLEALPGWTWSVLDTKWEEGFRQLQAYIAQTGTVRMLPKYRVGSYPLGSWVGTQRDAYRRGTLSEERIRRLESLPEWSWDPLAEKWERSFAALKGYADEHGNVRAPQDLEVDGVKLGQWASIQRAAYAKGKLSDERQKRLETLPGWSWNDVSLDVWEERFASLERFVAREGHARVPQKHLEDGAKLGLWVSIQRRNGLKGTLSEERRGRLEAIPGWTWHGKDVLWENNYVLLAEYTKESGTSRVPYGAMVEGMKLGVWVYGQRAAYAKGKLSEDRRKRLEKLPGWTWKPPRGAAARR